MPLTCRQKKAFRACVASLCAACFIWGVVMFAIWSSSAASTQKYCSGSTLIMITSYHDGATGVVVKDKGCR